MSRNTFQPSTSSRSTRTRDRTSPDLIKSVLSALHSGRRIEAAQLLEIIVTRDEPLGEKWQQIFKLAEAIGEINSAITASERYLHSNPHADHPILFHAGTLTKYRRHDEAIDLLRAAPTTLQKQFAYQHLMGVILSQLGKMGQARTWLERALSQQPQSGPSWLALSVIVDAAKDRRALDKMAQLETSFTQAPREKLIPYLFAIAKAYEDVGAFEKVIKYLHQANQLLSKTYEYNPEQDEQQAQLLIDNSKRLLNSDGPPISDNSSPLPLFIIGLPRSGTTLLEKIMSSRTDVEAGGELNLLHHAVAEAKAIHSKALEAFLTNQPPDPYLLPDRVYRSLTQQMLSGKPYFTDKSLNLSRLAGVIPHLFPEAPILWIRRNPRDNALSCYKNFLESSMGWSANLDNIAKHFRIEKRLRDHFTNLFPNIVAVDYEDLVSTPEQTIIDICDHIGWEFDPTMLTPEKNDSAIQTASVAQARSRISDKSINSWKNYQTLFSNFPDC